MVQAWALSPYQVVRVAASCLVAFGFVRQQLLLVLTPPHEIRLNHLMAPPQHPRMVI
jgi:hypothetical protein